MKKLFACVVCSALALGSARAEEALNYVAIGMSDGPSTAQRVVIAVMGTSAHDVVLAAYKRCYEQAAQGFMHTCKIGFGSTWVVGTVCSKGNAPIFDVETDEDSAASARDKGFEYLTKVENATPDTCKEVAEYNANNMQTARSVGKDKAH